MVYVENFYIFQSQLIVHVWKKNIKKKFLSGIRKGCEIVRVSLAKVLLFEATVRLKVFCYNCIAETMSSLRFFGVCSRF